MTTDRFRSTSIERERAVDETRSLVLRWNVTMTGSGDALREVLQALPAAVYTTDAAGHVTFYNQAAADLSGRRPELGTDRWCVSWRLFRPDGTPLPLDECPMALTLKQGRPVRGVEAILERPDGTRIPIMPYPTPLFDGAGRLVGGVNMLVDISDRKHAEARLEQLNRALARRARQQKQQTADAVTQLRKSEERFRLLLQGVTDYAIFMLDPDGTISNWNTGAQRIKGYTADEVIGRHFSIFYTDEDRRAGMPQIALDRAAAEGRHEREGWRVRKDGTRFWAGVVIDRILDDDGEIVGFAKVTRDLTEKRAAEEQLRLAQRMEAIGQLTGGVAHDFNNILTAIIGNLEMLASELPEHAAPRRHAETALRAALRGSRLTGQLLAYARRQEMRPEIVRISDLIREIAILCQKTVGEGVELSLRLAQDLWPSHIDPAQFEAAVLNLASNARDAMAGSGRLSITAANASVAAGEAGLSPGDYVVLAVADTGCGMTSEVRARAFEPFYTTKEVGKGTGLGLSQVYGFAQQSGGAAAIESREGHGTTVRLYLPRSIGVPAARQSAVSSPAALQPVLATILVVEDDAEVRETMVGILNRLGYRLLVAKTAAEALALLRGEPAIDLLFTDVLMPGGMSGVDLARAAGKLRPGLKILIGSGYVDEAAGIRDEFPFLPKPHLPGVLAEKLRELLDAPAQPLGYSR